MTEFYFNFGNPMVERLARAICKSYGDSPDSLVPETGYPNAEKIPLWWRKQNAAMDCLAVIRELGLIVDRSDDI